PFPTRRSSDLGGFLIPPLPSSIRIPYQRRSQHVTISFPRTRNITASRRSKAGSHYRRTCCSNLSNNCICLSRYKTCPRCIRAEKRREHLQPNRDPDR